MVVVLGSPIFLRDLSRPGRLAGGLGVGIALAAARAGARVELVGKVGHDDAGDAVAVELERAGVGHAALLRDPATRTPSGDQGTPLPLGEADVELALRYLVDFRVIVAADPLPAPVAGAVAAAARFAGAHRVVIGDDAAAGVTADRSATAGDAAQSATVGEEGGVPDPADAAITVLASRRPGETAFAEFVGRYAAYLDAGRDPADAFATAASDVGWEPARRG